MTSAFPRRRFALLLVAPLALVAACAPAQQMSPAAPAPVSTAPSMPTGQGPADEVARARCDAAPASRFVGRILDAAIERDARTAAGARTVRIIRPGMAVTMDYREDRLNIETDDGNRITRVQCG